MGCGFLDYGILSTKFTMNLLPTSSELAIWASNSHMPNSHIPNSHIPNNMTVLQRVSTNSKNIMIYFLFQYAHTYWSSQ
jgi:hypothetical protein